MYWQHGEMGLVCETDEDLGPSWLALPDDVGREMSEARAAEPVINPS